MAEILRVDPFATNKLTDRTADDANASREPNHSRNKV
jgi:hypothetical protein